MESYLIIAFILAAASFILKMIRDNFFEDVYKFIKKRISNSVSGYFKGKNDIREQIARYQEMLKACLHGNYHMGLDLQLETEKGAYAQNYAGNINTTPSENILWKIDIDAIMEDSNDYLLINASGMGKTTFLIHIALKYLERDARKYYPLILPCRSIEMKDVSHFIEKEIEERYSTSKTHLIKKNYENLCVLLDGLDQAVNYNDIAAGVGNYKYDNYKKAKLIISSRENTADCVSGQFNRIKLMIPQESEIIKYLGIDYYLQIKNYLSQNKLAVSAPVLLEMIKAVFDSNKINRISDRSKLYEEFIKTLIDKERKMARSWKSPLDFRKMERFLDYEIEDCLELISFKAMLRNEIGEIEKANLKDYYQNPEDVENLFNTNILLELFEDSDKHIIFRHQSFQAYFAARYIYKSRQDIVQELFFGNGMNIFYNDVWFETAKFYIAGVETDRELDILSNSMVAVNIKEPDMVVAALRLINFARLFSENSLSANVIKKICSHMADHFRKDPVLYNFLLIHSEKITAMKKQYQEIMRETLISGAERHTALVAVEDMFVTTPEAGKVEPDDTKSPEAIKKIRAELNDPSSWNRENALKALIRLGDSKYWNLALQRIGDDDFRVRETAAQALLMLATAKDLPAIKNNLHKMIRWEQGNEGFNDNQETAAINILGKIGNKEDIKKLGDLLSKHKSGRVNAEIITVLAAKGSDDDLELIKPFLESNNDDIHRAVIDAIGKLGTSGDIEIIMELKQKEVSNMKKRMSYPGDEEYDELRRHGHFDSFDSRKLISIINAIGNIGGPGEVASLQGLLTMTNVNTDVQEAVSVAIGKIGDIEHVKLLLPLLNIPGLYRAKSNWGAETVSPVDFWKIIAQAIENIYRRHHNDMAHFLKKWSSVATTSNSP